VTNKIETKDEFYKELNKVAKISYDKDFYEWTWHYIEYMYDLAVFIHENDKFISQPDGTYKRTHELLSLGSDLERYYSDRRKTDDRGVHGA
jgi:hypothetical protein